MRCGSAADAFVASVASGLDARARCSWLTVSPLTPVPARPSRSAPPSIPAYGRLRLPHSTPVYPSRHDRATDCSGHRIRDRNDRPRRLVRPHPLGRPDLALIGTAPFVRLERIQQLGFVSRVWPGARHTRFEHSLGVMHLTRLAIDHIRSNPEGRWLTDGDARVAVAAALLHDIGHYPFSHAIEELGSPIVPHERGGRRLIEGSQIGPILEDAWASIRGGSPISSIPTAQICRRPTNCCAGCFPARSIWTNWITCLATPGPAMCRTAASTRRASSMR